MKYIKTVSVVFVLFLISAVAYTGVMESIKTAATAAGTGGLWAGLVALVLVYILKVIPNDKIQAIVGKTAYGLGVTLTLGLSQYKWSKPFWRDIVEPWFIDLVNNTVGTFVTKFIEGLRSDNA